MGRRALVLLAVFVAIAIGLLVWHSRYGSKAVAERRIERLTAGSLSSLTPEEVATIVESQYQQQPQVLSQLAENPEARKEYLDQELRPLLALARQARIEGLAEDKEVRQQLELQELQILAIAYDQKLKKDAGKPNDPGPPLGWVEGTISNEEREAFLNEPETAAKFEKLIKTIEEQNPVKQKLGEEQRDYIRRQWATAMIARKKAKEVGLDREPETRLQLQMQEVRVLANKYAQRNEKKFEPTKEEIAAYIKEHPELDLSKKREQAQVVLQRARGGEDFAKLAAEFSEDPGSKDKGGLYENVKQGMFVPEFEAAALALEPGQISDIVETQYGYHVIKLEGKGTEKDKEGKEQETFTVRHILLMTMARDASNPFAQPVPMEQKARQAAQQAKVEKFLEELVAKNPINLPAPEEIKIDVPEMPENSALEGIQHGAGDGHDHGETPRAPTVKPAPSKGSEPAKPKK